MAGTGRLEDSPIGQSQRCDLPPSTSSVLRYSEDSAERGEAEAKWKDFYKCSKKSPFLSVLVYLLCRRAEVPVDETNFLVKNDDPFNPLLVNMKPSKAPKKRKVGEAESSQATVDSGDEDEDTPAPPTHSQPLISSSGLEEDLAAIRRYMEIFPSETSPVPDST